MESQQSLSTADFSDEQNIGGGGQGTTFLATLKKIGQQIVYKKIIIESQTKRDYAEREFQVHQSLSFRFITREKLFLHSYGVLLRGVSTIIDIIIKEQSLFAWDILAQLSMAVNYLHSLRIVHKDLKPSNVFLTKNNEGRLTENNEKHLSKNIEIRLGDFGFSKFLNATLSFTKSESCTPQYVSPELLIEKKFRMSSDVWGIGATIFTLINRRPPFSGTCDELQYNIIAEEKFPDPIIDIYSQRLRDTVMAMLIKNRKKRITMNILVTIPEIRERIDKYAGEMLETSEGYLKGYLERLINNVDTAPASLPKNGLIKSNILSIDQQQIDPDNVRFEIKDDQIAEQYPGAPGQSIVKLIQLKQKLNNIITISPVINKGDGVVRIQLKFNDNGSQDMNDRCFGIIDASYSIPDKFQLGFNKESALYRGKEIIDKYSGKVFHMNSESGNQVFETSDKFKNDDIITAEVNMHLEKEERTLHFFVNNQWQNCSFQNLPDSIKFCVQLSYANTSVSILSMEKLPNPTENKNIKSICEIIW